MLPELQARLADNPRDLALIDSIVAVSRLGNPDAGWKTLGSPTPKTRVWRYVSLDPIQEKDERPLGEL